MPISVSKIQEKRKTVEVDFGEGEKAEITYRPGAYTPDMEAEARAGMREGDRDILGAMVVRIVEDWDIYEDAGQKRKVPITPERVRTLPVVVLFPIFEAINEDIRPKPKTGGSFSGG